MVTELYKILQKSQGVLQVVLKRNTIRPRQSRYKLPPPLFDGSYGKREEWRNKFIVYIALQHYEYVPLLHLTESATATLY